MQLEAINGWVSKAAKRQGLETPLNDALVELVQLSMHHGRCLSSITVWLTVVVGLRVVLWAALVAIDSKQKVVLANPFTANSLSCGHSANLSQPVYKNNCLAASTQQSWWSGWLIVTVSIAG